MNSTPFFFPRLTTTSSSSSSSALNKETKMENDCKWDQSALMSELTEGMELTKQLNTHLINLSASSSSSSLLPPQQFHLLQKILSSYQKALLILQPQTVVPLLESYSSPNASPHPQPDHHHHHSISKKRKVSSSSSSAWRSQVRIRSENGLECPSEDGYSWRKYGQKDILAAKYPRSYYRCTYRSVQGCWATKQVQRSDEDPSLFDITYKGKHTCNLNRSLPVSSPATPQTQEINHHHHMQQQQQHQQQQINSETLLNLRNNLRVDTQNNEQMKEAHFPLPSTSFDPFATFFAEDNLLGGFSSSSIKFLSPDTSEYSNNYLQTNSCEMNGFGGFNDLSEIISANTSVTNSPVVGYDLDFSIEPARLGSFAFDDDQVPDFSANNCNWN